MIILDTNVISEPVKKEPNAAVIQWLDEQAAETLYLTSTTLTELYCGIERLPIGRRKNTLAAQLALLLERLFGPRILPFDGSAAMKYALLVARANENGFNPSVADAQIAAVAKDRGFAIATQNADDFKQFDVPVINPWTGA